MGTVHRVCTNSWGTDAALAHQQALVHELLDRPPRGGAGQLEAIGECQLVF